MCDVIHVFFSVHICIDASLRFNVSLKFPFWPRFLFKDFASSLHPVNRLWAQERRDAASFMGFFTKSPIEHTMSAYPFVMHLINNFSFSLHTHTVRIVKCMYVCATHMYIVEDELLLHSCTHNGKNESLYYYLRWRWRLLMITIML